MAYKVIILYQLYMPSYFLGTFTEYPYLYNNFQQKLKDKFPSLNEKEIQLCCLIRGGFKTDEIAFVIRQSVYSIHKRKTAIRKKLGMDERADILTIILSLLDNS